MKEKLFRFGGVEFNGTIIESNDIAIYMYISPRFLVPPNFKGAWFENNGYVRGGSTTIDSWAAEVRSDQILTNRTIIIDGPNGEQTRRINFSTGNVTDIWLTTTTTTTKPTTTTTTQKRRWNAHSTTSFFINPSSFTIHFSMSSIHALFPKLVFREEKTCKSQKKTKQSEKFSKQYEAKEEIKLALFCRSCSKSCFYFCRRPSGRWEA